MLPYGIQLCPRPLTNTATRRKPGLSALSSDRPEPSSATRTLVGAVPCRVAHRSCRPGIARTTLAATSAPAPYAAARTLHLVGVVLSLSASAPKAALSRNSAFNVPAVP